MTDDTGMHLGNTESDPLMTPSEVAGLFRVDPKTVTRWAVEGKIGSIRTPGGHRRYWQSEVLNLLKAGREEAKQA